MVTAKARELRRILFPTREVAPGGPLDWRLATEPLAPQTRDDIAIGQGRCLSMNFERLRRVDSPFLGTILYVHGGGFVCGSATTHRPISLRLAAAGYEVIVPSYRLAPENPFPAALVDIIHAWRWFRRQRKNRPHFIVGDSAGAALALAALQRLKKYRAPMPNAAVFMSPWLDLTLSGASYSSRKDLDPLDRKASLAQMAAYYSDGSNIIDPLLSPLFGDMTGLPPILIQVGDHEVLLSDSTRLARRLRQAGCSVKLERWQSMWHVWQLAAPELPEANDAIERILKFLSR